MSESNVLADVQGSAAKRRAVLAQAGISALLMPARFIDPEEGAQETVVQISAWAKVPAHQRGAHMSRLPASMHQLRQGFSPSLLANFVEDLATLMDAPAAGLELDMSLFLSRTAPVTGTPSWLDIKVGYRVWTNGPHRPTLECTIAVPVTMLCPCSKEISARGAHSQRGRIETRLQLASGTQPGSPLSLARRLETSASAQLYAVLKRADEKKVTEQAYDNPRFAEDTAREAATLLASESGLSSWSVRALTCESIHNHDVFAVADSESATKG